MTSIAQQRRVGWYEFLCELGRFGDSGLLLADEGPGLWRGWIRIVTFHLLRLR